MAERMKVAIMGCGNIAGPYLKTLSTYPELELAGAYDLDRERAAKAVAEYGGKVYETLEALLGDPAVSIIVNLTIHHVHYELTKRCLEAGKHVFSEKPLALTPAEAKELVKLAKTKKVRLGSSPFTWLGEGQQTAWKLIREGKLGTVRLVYAEVNHGRIESWHPNPGPFYAVGPWFDVGVYPLTLLTTFFGPAQWVQAHGQVLYPDRVTKEGKPFHIDTPDCMLATVGLAGGQIARLTVNFYVRTTKQVGIEFHGDAGSLHLSSWQGFQAEVAYGEFGKPLEIVPPVKPPFEGTEWGRGIREMAEAIRAKRPHRATGAQAAHVVEILAAGMKSSAQKGKRVTIRSTFPPPAPMEWA